ncbi:Retrovirus-related Pol polyprotein, partial [Mucuna pruriens]
MDRIFKENIGSQLEVYVDDMVVKSTTEVGHVDNLSSIFGVLRRHQLKLNPEKCSFGVKASKFLGFMLTRRGKPIYVYMSISDNAMRSIIIQEEKGEQQLVYYMSKVLQRAELRYQKIEKATLVMIITARKLSPYFQSQPVVCRVDLPI